MPSKVWKVFHKSSDTSATCNICDRVLAYKGGSTSSLLGHIKNFHPASLEETDAAKQTRLTFSRKCDPRRSSAISERVARMIAEDGLPISVVEGKGFKSLMNYIEPDYTLPTRKTVVSILDKMFTEKKERVKEDLQKSASIALTTDCWTSHAQEGYMTVTAHGIVDWKKTSFVLETTPVAHLAGEEEEEEGGGRLPQRHTALALQAQLNRVAVEWEVDGKICAVVHDNASNVRAIGQAVQASDVGCTAHTLQLCVNAGLESNQTLKSCIGAVSRLVGHFRHSVIASQALSAKQEQHNLPRHKLIQSVKTRWNSVYEMFRRVHEQRWAITSVLGDERVTPRRDASTYELKDEHWTIIDKMVKVLEPFQMATTVLSSDANPTLSSVLPMISGLLSNFLNVDENDPRPVQQFKRTTATELKRRFNIKPEEEEDVEDEPTTLHLSSALDPRYRLTHFSNTTKDKVMTKLRSQLPDRDEPDEGMDVERPSTSLDFLITGRRFVPVERQEEVDEVLNFSEGRNVAPDTDPLSWWKANTAMYPRLSKVAAKYLTIPATSVPSERVFSTAGNIVNIKRSCLLPENVNMLVFLKQNAD